MDYLHGISWRAAEAIVKAGGSTVTVAGMRMLPLKTAVEKGLLYFVPEPKSPHGVDVTPDGTEIVIGGKLDTHTTVFSFAKIKSLIDAQKFEGRDAYGVPILPYKDSIR